MTLDNRARTTDVQLFFTSPQVNVLYTLAHVNILINIHKMAGLQFHSTSQVP